MQIISEKDLSQLAQIRPLRFGFHEQSNIKTYFQVLQKRVEEQEIFQEYMVNISVLTKVYMLFIFHITTRGFLFFSF